MRKIHTLLHSISAQKKIDQRNGWTYNLKWGQSFVRELRFHMPWPKQTNKQKTA